MPKPKLQVKPFDPVNNAQPPQRMTDGAVGFDFWAEEIIRETSSMIWYRTGYGVNIPNAYFGDLRARSSVSKTGLVLANGAGVVDPDYQGEIQFRFYKVWEDESVYKLEPDRVDGAQRSWMRRSEIYEPGERLGQMILVPHKSHLFGGVEVIDDFDHKTERGEGGHGSTGK